jgi:hypothetical protein
MGERTSEPYLYLAEVRHDAALIAWGAFAFAQAGSSGDEVWAIVDDEPVREERIGQRSKPLGPGVVEVRTPGGPVVATARCQDANHAWVRGLAPDTTYEYRVLVAGEEWAAGQRRDWVPGRDGRPGTLRPGGRYDNRFRTHPAHDRAAPLRFAALGDFGVGVCRDTEAARRQWRVARALEAAVARHGVQLVVTTGDNIYLGEGKAAGGSGDEDADWFFTFYQPYRYVINRVPVYPTVGNHDAGETEQSDDREQLEDNFFLDERFGRGAHGPDSIGPGLFYSLRYGSEIELVSVDSTAGGDVGVPRYFQHPPHRRFLEEIFAPGRGRGRWLIPFSHHPPLCAGPHHDNDEEMIRDLLPLYAAAGVRAVLSGHEHNFQYSIRGDLHCFLSGAGGKLRADPPRRFERAGTRAFAVEGHFLLVDVRGDELTVTPVADVEPDGSLKPLAVRAPDALPVTTPFVVRR